MIESEGSMAGSAEHLKCGVHGCYFEAVPSRTVTSACGPDVLELFSPQRGEGFSALYALLPSNATPEMILAIATQFVIDSLKRGDFALKDLCVPGAIKATAAQLTKLRAGMQNPS